MIAVFTPSKRPGLDVTVASLQRQQRGDLLWILGDTLDRKISLWSGIRATRFDSRKLTSRWGSLEAAYNRAVEIARRESCDLFVSLQDYIWAPPGGIARFERMAAEHPRSLLTGAMSISDEPAASAIVDPSGAYTVFAEAYTARPRMPDWPMGPDSQTGIDCRLDRFDKDSGFANVVSDTVRQMSVEVERFELNWAAIPRALLYDERLSFDERYDQGWAYGNQAYAIRAIQLGYDIWLDADNHAIGLPHKTYFPEEQADLEAHSNRPMHQLRERLYR
jgi:hypothetical protein